MLCVVSAFTVSDRPALASTAITLEQPVHFIAIDGSAVRLAAGTYQIEAAEGWVKVVPQGGSPNEAVVLEAVAGTHNEPLEAPVAVSVPGDEDDVHHLVLLFPDGKTLEAVGSSSGIRKRGLFARLTPSRLHTVIKAKRAQRPRMAQLRTQPSASAFADSNPCVKNVLAEFRKIRTHGDKLGFHHSQTPGAYETSSSHYQGIQRLRNGKFLAVSGSTSHTGEVLLVEMGSRSGTTRLRSNRLTSNTPPSPDRVLNPVISVSKKYTHAGGIQVLGDYLVVGVEKNGKSEVAFYNIRDPRNPRFLHKIIRTQPLGGFKDDPTAGAVGLTKRKDGRFLLLVARWNSNVLDFYLSQTTDLSSTTFSHIDSWKENELKGMDREFADYQSINFVQQCDGQLFLVGTHRHFKVKTTKSFGKDWADLFKFELARTGQSGITTYHTAITKIANLHLYCQDTCNLQKGGGVYVSSKGEIFIYGVEQNRHNNLVRFNEFRPVPTSANPALTNINSAWVELYDDRGFKDRSIMVDFLDRNLRNYRDYDKVDGFEDKTSSAKWLLPRGWQYFLFEDKNYKGRMLKLAGTGRVESVSDMKSRGWNDKVSSSRFMKEGITRLDQAWVELFDDRNFKDRRLIVKGSSGSIRNYKKITVEGKRGFGDKASSVRFMIPHGYVYRLYEDDSYRGKTLELVGTGTVLEISDFNSLHFNDKVSSSKFVRK